MEIRKTMKVFQILLLMHVAGNIIKPVYCKERIVIMPRTEAAAYSKEGHKIHELNSAIINLNNDMLDRFRNFHALLSSTETNIKSFIFNTDNKLINDLKRKFAELNQVLTKFMLKHNKAITDLTRLHKSDTIMLSSQLEKHSAYVESNMDILKKALAVVMDKLSTMQDILAKVFVDVKNIMKNNDLGSTDSNSVGKQIADISSSLSTIEDALSIIDRRLPGFDDNGELILQRLSNNFETLNKKLPSSDIWEKMLMDIKSNVENLSKLISSASYPEIDNHVPNSGNVNVLINEDEDFEYIKVNNEL
ncbi:MAG: hypothetical protein [Cotesia congregata filamentous virus 2]